MRWEKNYGSRLDVLEKMEKRGKNPKALADRPLPFPPAVPYLSAFKRLSFARGFGPNGEPQAIPISEVEAYTRMFGFTDVDDFLYFIQVCDHAWISAEVARHGNKSPSRSR